MRKPHPPPAPSPRGRGGERPLAAALVALLLAAAPAAAAKFDPRAGIPAPTALSPLARVGEVERRTPENLWERIDGEAELYKSYDFVSSAHARYEDPADPDRSVTLSVFMMEREIGAFGLFASFRPRDCARVVPIGNGACLGGEQGIFWHGAFFVVADAAGPDAWRVSDLRRALEAAAAALGTAPKRPEFLRVFARFADTETIRYHPVHLLGRKVFPPGLEGSSDGVTWFLTEGACNLEAIYATYSETLQGAVRSEPGGLRTLSGFDPELGPITLSGG